MAVLDTTKIAIPSDVVTTIAKDVQGASAIAALSPAVPSSMLAKEYNYFSGNAVAEVVGEGANKSAYEQIVKPVKATQLTVQTTTRVSNQLKWTDEDAQAQIIKSILADQAKAIGRALDTIVFNGQNPKDNSSLTGVTALTVGATSVTADKDAAKHLDQLAAALIDYEINGVALSRQEAGDLRAVRTSTGVRMYSEIPLNLTDGAQVDGIRAAVSNTVKPVLAIMGDFDLIKWGLSREMFTEEIAFGDPDGAGDLKRMNQVAYRTEAVLNFAVLDPKGFAILKAKAGSSSPTV